jgi:hypothetical protein
MLIRRPGPTSYRQCCHELGPDTCGAGLTLGRSPKGSGPISAKFNECGRQVGA